MIRGLSLPLRVNKGGGAAKEKEENQLDKLIVLAVQEGGDNNPFQNLGLSSSVIYRINDETSKFDIADEIKRVLKSFKGRIELGSNGVVVNAENNTPQTEEGVMNVSFEYMNLDIDDARFFEDLLTSLGAE